MPAEERRPSPRKRGGARRAAGKAEGLAAAAGWSFVLSRGAALPLAVASCFSGPDALCPADPLGFKHFFCSR